MLNCKFGEWRQPWRRLVLEGETGFDGDLPVVDGAVFDMAAGFDDLEPAEVADGFAGALDGVFDCGLDATRGGADEFDEFVGVFAHGVRSEYRMGMCERGYESELGRRRDFSYCEAAAVMR